MVELVRMTIPDRLDFLTAPRGECALNLLRTLPVGDRNLYVFNIWYTSRKNLDLIGMVRSTCYIYAAQFCMLSRSQRLFLKKRSRVVLIDMYQDNIQDMIRQRFEQFPYMEEMDEEKKVIRRQAKGFFFWLSKSAA